MYTWMYICILVARLVCVFYICRRVTECVCTHTHPSIIFIHSCLQLLWICYSFSNSSSLNVCVCLRVYDKVEAHYMSSTRYITLCCYFPLKCDIYMYWIRTQRVVSSIFTLCWMSVKWCFVCPPPFHRGETCRERDDF